MTSSPTLPLPESLSLAGRRITVTGAASGIGRATANVLSSLGADLVLVDIASLEATYSDLAGSGPAPTTIQADLLAPGVVNQLFAGRRVDALVHCAGVIPTVPWDEDPEWEGRFARVMAVNVRLPIELGHACIAHMAGHGGGRVVLTGSLAGWSGGTLPSTPPDYAASKGALHAMVRLLSRKGVAAGVLVNAVAPGPVRTPFSANSNFPSEVFPLGRIAEPAEIAWTMAFLCTPAASYFSGEIININGGMFLGYSKALRSP
jgi:3-oxoacyl-[acyl-carrier protein] reductase